jgi:PKHD-type hydroxylase
MNKSLVFSTNPKIDQTNYYWFENIFLSEEYDYINNLQELYPFEKAKVIDDSINTDSQARKSEIKWLHHDEKSDWLYNKIETMVLEANQTWGFDLHSIRDSIQYTEYYEGGGHYDWHMDAGPFPINNRKISITIQLSDPNDYIGGDLEIWTGNGVQTCARQKGAALLFPSYMLHRVTPVLEGTRKSLVLWVGGGSYK